MENLDSVKELRILLNQKQIGITNCSGVYCWWFRKNAAETLIANIPLTESETKRISKRIIGNDEYWALYFGISKDMLNRAKWHILQKHTLSTVINGALSTLRQTLSGLLGNRMTESENIVNQFIDDNCYWEWEYDTNPKLRESEELSSGTKCYPLNIQENRTVSKIVLKRLKEVRRQYKN